MEIWLSVSIGTIIAVFSICAVGKDILKRIDALAQSSHRRVDQQDEKINGLRDEIRRMRIEQAKMWRGENPPKAFEEWLSEVKTRL